MIRLWNFISKPLYQNLHIPPLHVPILVTVGTMHILFIPTRPIMQCWVITTLRRPPRSVSKTTLSIRNIATNVASMFTRTCRLSWRHLDCRDVIKICGQLWSQEQPYMKFWASFPQIYRLQQAKQIRKLMKQKGLACWKRKI